MAKRKENPSQLNFLDLLKVNQAAFEGPLSLMLELIRKHKLEVHEIQLAEICAPYLEFLGLMEHFNLDVAVEFLDLASTLVLIKSRALLPILEPPEEEEVTDPEEELRARLLAYQQAQNLALLMTKIPRLGRDHFARPLGTEEHSQNQMGPLEDLTVYRLLEGYQRVGKKQTFKKPHLVVDEEESLQEKINQFVFVLQPNEHRRFSTLLSPLRPKPEVVVSFLAVLELTKFGGLALTQAQPFAELHLFVKPTFVSLKERYLNPSG